MRKLSEKFHIYYGWFIVAYSLIVVALVYGIGHNCFSLFIKPVCAKFGFDRKSFSLCLTIQYIMYMVVSLLSGPLFKKFSLRKLMVLACFVLPLSYFMFSFCETLPMFYLVSVIVGGFIPMLSFQAFTILISQWFTDKRGTATGIVFMGSGVGGMIFNALAGRWVENYGVTATYRLLALVMGVLVIPLILFLVKEKPQDLKMLPYTEKKAGDASAETRRKPVIYGPTFKEAIRSANFWIVILTAFGIGYSTGALANNIVPHVSDVGYSAIYAANVSAAYLGAISVAKILLGVMFDKLGLKKAVVFCFIFLILGFTGIFFAKYQPMHILLVIGAAVGCSTGTLAYPLLTQSVFGTKDYAVLNGIVMAVGSFGGSIGPFVNNAVYDACGTYNPVFIAGTVMALLVIVLVLAVRLVKRPE